MNLEPKHLTVYLPYELKLKTIDMFENDPVFTLALKEGGKRNTCIDWVIREPECFKLILRPLSDLTNDTFDFIYNTECDYPSIKKWIELDTESRLSSKFSYNFWELLYQYHFDIHGLIEKGLAIDINNQ